jgi:ABC-2 type transport system permease protein
MRWRRFAAITRKEIIQIRRDSRSLSIVVAMPLLLMFLFGYGVSLDMKNIPTYVLDRESSQLSRALVSRFRASRYFDVVRAVDNYPDLIRAIDAGQARLAIVIPSDFSERLNNGGPVAVQAIVDATDDNTANLAIAYSDAVVRAFSAGVQLEWIERRGLSPPEPPLRIEARTWYNENLESSAFIVPGVIAIVMAVVGTFLTSLTIAREWERGTMEQLISTPVTPLELMLGKLVPYFIIGMLDTALCALISIEGFRVPFRGHLSALFLSSALFLVVVLSLGYFISVVAKTQVAASQMALISTFMPAFLLSGFLYSIQQMPAAVRTFTYIVPARYYVALLKDLFLKGSPLAFLRAELAALAVFALVLGTLATRSFHKRLG